MLRSRESLLFPLLLVLVLLLTTKPPLADSVSNSLTVNTDGPLEDCQDLDIRFGDDEGDLPMVRDEVVLTPGSIGALRAALSGPQGVSVRAEDRKDYSVRVCLAAAGRPVKEAQALLERIHVSFEGGRVGIEGPEQDSQWVAHIIARVPLAGSVELSSENGPIDVRGLDGSVVVRAVNGPLSLYDCAGTVKATTENGPIEVIGSGGEHRIRTENGPIQIGLRGGSWSSGSLDARSENGPLGLELPPGYRSGVRVEMSEHSPFSCKAPTCDDARKTWSEGTRSLAIGGSEPLVRLSTQNGPVQIARPKPDGGV